mgnify:CR=1 FL=1
MIMKIDAIVREEKFEDVKNALMDIEVNGLTVSQVMGCGLQRGYKEIVRGMEVEPQMQPKIKFEIVVSSEEWADKTIYFGPMGCRTGFYVIFAGDLESEDIIDVLREAADFVLDYEGEIPGYSPRDCGNYLDNNLTLAKIYMKKYKEEVLDNPVPERLHYPQ